MIAGNNAKLDQLNDKLDRINLKFDQLNTKFDQLNGKFDGLNAAFKALILRQDDVEKNASSVRSLHWDHSAISMRLAQLEDRLLDAAEDLANDIEASDSFAAASFRFPGSERFEKGKAG